MIACRFYAFNAKLNIFFSFIFKLCLLITLFLFCYGFCTALKQVQYSFFKKMKSYTMLASLE